MRARARDHLPLPLALEVDDDEVDDRAEVLVARERLQVRPVVGGLGEQPHELRVAEGRAEEDDAFVDVREARRLTRDAEPFEREPRHRAALVLDDEDEEAAEVVAEEEAAAVGIDGAHRLEGREVDGDRDVGGAAVVRDRALADDEDAARELHGDEELGARVHLRSRGAGRV